MQNCHAEYKLAVMQKTTPLQFHQRLWFAWVVPVVAFWLTLYVLTRNADPMAYQIIYSAALLVPTANAWTLVPKFRTRITATLIGFILPIVAVVFFAVA